MSARAPFLYRALRTARLDAEAFEEVEADRGALPQALLLVIGAALSNAVGAAFVFSAAGSSGPRLAFQVTVSLLMPLTIWLGGAAFAYMAGASFFRGRETETDFTEVLRTTGFAFGPGWLLGAGALPPPGLGIAIGWIASAWVLVAAIVAIRQALDFTTARAVGSFGAAALLLWLVLWGLAAAPIPF